MNKIVNRYIFRELLPPFFISLIFFLFVFLMTQILQLTHLIVNYKVGLLEVLQLLLYTSPYFLKYTMPISVMISVFLVVLRMAADNEIIALKAGGISMPRVLIPVLFFCFLGYGVSMFMSSYAAPKGAYAFKEKLGEMAAASAGAGIQERVFNTAFDGVMLYATKMNIKDKSLENVFIEDRRMATEGVTVTAPMGKLNSNPAKNQLQLKLFNGMINQVNIKTQGVQTIYFDTYDINIDLGKVSADKILVEKGKREMTLIDLYEFCYVQNILDIQKLNDRRTRFHVMLAFPVACLVLGFAAFPLGLLSVMVRRRSGKSIGICISLLVLYYVLYGFANTLGKSGDLNPAIGTWIPNIVLLFVGAGLFIKVNRD